MIQDNPVIIGASIIAGVLLILSRSFLTTFREWADEKRRRSVEREEQEDSAYLKRIQLLEFQLDQERKERKAFEDAVKKERLQERAWKEAHAAWDREVYEKCMSLGIQISIPPPMF